MSEGWSYYLDFKDETFELRDGEQAVGRSRTCDVSIDDPSVSRRHVSIRAEGGRVLLEDLGSSNGSFINGERVEGGGELRDGDTLGLGDADLKVRVVGTSAFETVRLSAHPVEQHGEATLFLQRASEKLAAEALDHGEELAAAAPSHMAPAPIQPAAAPPEPAVPSAPSHMAPPPLQPSAAPPEPAPPSVPPEPAAPPTPPPAPPEAPAPPPAPPEPAALPEPPAAPPVAAPSPVAPPSPPPTPAPVAPAAVGAQSVLDHTTGDQAAGDLLPSLDGFDITMGPEMMRAVKPRAGEESSAEAYNPYGAPQLRAPAPAGFGIRLAAYLVDVAWILVLVAVSSLWAKSLGSSLAYGTACGAAWLVVLFGWAIWGTTPGKRAFNLYVTSGAGGEAGIGFPRALARALGYALSAVLLGVGFLMIAFSPSKRGLHDLIAGTRVERQV